MLFTWSLIPFSLIRSPRCLMKTTNYEIPYCAVFSVLLHLIQIDTIICTRYCHQYQPWEIRLSSPKTRSYSRIYPHPQRCFKLCQPALVHHSRPVCAISRSFPHLWLVCRNKLWDKWRDGEFSRKIAGPINHIRLASHSPLSVQYPSWTSERAVEIFVEIFVKQRRNCPWITCVFRSDRRTGTVKIITYKFYLNHYFVLRSF
jgi:hypothetical protein